MRVKCFWVGMIEPRVDDWEGGIGRPRYRRLDTGEELRGELPIGALYVAKDEPAGRWSYPKGSDGLSVWCVVPEKRGIHHWCIDSRASNCTMKTDDQHRCWVRHGTFGGTIHVDKSGLTCAAGAGSILTDGWHGFLHNGELYSC